MFDPNDTKANTAKYLRELADKIESGKATAVVTAHVETCDNCPDHHSHIMQWIEPETFNKVGMIFVGVASFVHQRVVQLIGHLDMQQAFQTVMAQAQAKGATKQ